MKERFVLFALTYRQRQSKGQRRKFIIAAAQTLADLGYKVETHLFKIGFKSGFNLIAGSLENAKTVFITAFDTKELILNSKAKYYLFNREKNRDLLRKNLVIYLLLSLPVMVATIYILQQAIAAEGLKRIVFFVLSVFTALLATRISRGWPANRNFQKSSALFMMFELAAELAAKDCCFVFTDLSLYHAIGETMFINEHNLKAKKVVYIESCCNSDKLLCGYSDNISQKNLTTIKSLSAFDYLCQQDVPQAKSGGFEYYFVSEFVTDNGNEPYLANFCSRKDTNLNEASFNKAKTTIKELYRALS